MKRKIFSSIFSTKTFGIILFIILGFFSFNLKNTEARIVVRVKLNNKDTSFLMSQNPLPLQANSTWCAGDYVRVTHPSSLGSTYSCYKLQDIDPSFLDQINTLVSEKVKLNQNRNASDLKDLFKEEYNLINNITDTSYPDSIRYLKDSLDWGMDSATKSYQSIYDNLKNRDDGDDVFDESQIDKIAKKMATIYVYNAMSAFLLKDGTTLEYEKIPEAVMDIARQIRENKGEDLDNNEKGGATSFNFNKASFNIPTKYPDYVENPETGGSITNPDGTVDVTAGTATCQETNLWKVMNNDNCSFAAFLVNSALVGLSQLLGGLMTLVGNIFDWVVRFSIYEFNAWVENSGAYTVWRTIILSLVTSLILPIVFYYIIRMLIDNDTTNIKKILPRILITALFIYFSFAIVGWITDQSNLLSIYIYRSMSDSNQNIGEGLKRVLNIEASLPPGTAKADWSLTLFHLVRLAVNGISVIVLLQGVVLLFLRAAVLLLCIIFSPLMLLPAGINDYIDKYRGMIISYFINALISAPIFMFIVLVAMKISEAARTSVVENVQLNSITNGMTGASEMGQNFMGLTISSIIAIIVLQLAITVSKKMSSDFGGQIAGKVAVMAGGVALGTSARALQFGARKVAGSDTFQGWIQKQEGGAKNINKLLAAGGRQLDRTLSTSTFDARNIGKKVASKEESRETVRDKAQLRTVKRDIGFVNNKLSEKDLSESDRKYWNSQLGTLSKQERELTTKISGKKQTSLADTVNETFREFPTADDAALKRKEDRIKAALDKDFEERGKGKNYFSESMDKPENEKFKNDFLNAMKETNPREAFMSLSKVLADFQTVERERAREEKKIKLKQEKGEKATTNSDVTPRSEKSSEPEIVVVRDGEGRKPSTEAPKTVESKTVREVLEKNENEFGSEFRAGSLSEKKRIIQHLREKTGEENSKKATSESSASSKQAS